MSFQYSKAPSKPIALDLWRVWLRITIGALIFATVAVIGTLADLSQSVILIVAIILSSPFIILTFVIDYTGKFSQRTLKMLQNQSLLQEKDDAESETGMLIVEISETRMTQRSWHEDQKTTQTTAFDFQILKRIPQHSSTTA